MARVVDWVEQMEQVIAEHGYRPFERGRSDCFCLSMDVAEAVTGTDPFADKRGYTTERGALRMVKRMGVETLADALALRLVECPPMIARRADLVTFGDGLGVGVVTGAMVVSKDPASKSAGHMIVLPLHAAARAFRIG